MIRHAIYETQSDKKSISHVYMCRYIEWDLDNSYPRQIVPKTIRTKDNPYPRRLSRLGYELSWIRVVLDTIRTSIQINSYT